MSISNDIKVLKKIELTRDVISVFQYEETTAWISIKDMLTSFMYDKNVRLETGNKKGIVSWIGLKTIIFSVKEYFLHIKAKEKKNIFLGASTGLFNFEDKILDAYFPYYDVDTRACIYMLNCGNLNELNKYKTYMKKNHIVIENYLVVILKKILANFLFFTLPKEKIKEIKDFSVYLKTESIEVSNKALRAKYSEFIAGYKLYKLFFKFLKIEKAYIVSTPTKSDMVASLKSLGIEVIEIQHGIVGELHRGYNFKLDKTKLLPTADKIDVYNKFWKDEIIKAGYFDESSINIVGRLKYDIVKNDIKDLNFKYIVFTGQGAFFKQIILFFKNSDKFLIKHNIKIFYKAHPRELKHEIEFFKQEIKNLKSCLFYEGRHTTEELIKYSYAHVSVFSSCHFDAIYYKNKTYVLDVMVENIMHYYSSNSPDSVIKIKKVEEIINNEIIN